MSSHPYLFLGSYRQFKLAVEFRCSMGGVLEAPKHHVPTILGQKLGQRSYEGESYTP
jgi:hypothetical protein